MKKLTFCLALIFSPIAFAHEAPPHLDLEMTSLEYQEHLKTIESLTEDHPAITEALNLGSRLSQWITLINEGRSESAAIRLTSSATRGGIPIDKPSTYSPELIHERIGEILKDLPKEFKDILLSRTDLPRTLPVDDETFIKYARLIDRQYQSAARFKSIDQWRGHYADAANKDVRGYYYLTTNKIQEAELRDRALIPEEKIAPIKEALIQICQNATSNLDRCSKNLEKAYEKNTLARFYKSYFTQAQKNWDSFFIIPKNARRRDIVWEKNIAIVPFNTPKIEKFIPYLQDNIEDEFRFENWGLKLNFGSFTNGPRLIFRPNVVPHVNALGGNEIVMDSNQAIEEYESQWTIRHEFGHVLGLPDCYHEFYDMKNKVYVNYQFDITDLMCSRAGDMNERIYLELKKVYEK